jgi:hypothetical protein
MWPRRQGSSPAQRANAFAQAHFPRCAVHSEEAASVYATLEELNRKPLPSDDPDTALVELVPSLAPTGEDVDSLDAIERQLAVEAELGQSDRARVALAERAHESIVKPLLGGAWGSSRWDPRTIWLRSIRGIVNERVRYRGGCSCGEAPSNNEMQLTRSAMVNDWRGPRS